MKKDEMHHTGNSIERRVREADVIQRAKAASAGTSAPPEIVRRPVDGMDERFGFSADSDHLRL